MQLADLDASIDGWRPILHSDSHGYRPRRGREGQHTFAGDRQTAAPSVSRWLPSGNQSMIVA